MAEADYRSLPWRVTLVVGKATYRDYLIGVRDPGCEVRGNLVPTCDVRSFL